MSHYRHPAMKQFADQQVRFAPQERKLSQLARAEALLAQIDPKRGYPYQFVVFRITDARSEMYPDLVLKGDDLIHDLRLWIDQVSASAPVDIREVGEPVLTVEEISKRYRISTKTVSRWRDRGLVSRRFLFGGRRRVGFLQSSVDRFVGTHSSEVERGSRFSQMSDAERDEIVRWAKQMSSLPNANLAEVSRRLAARTKRSPETIRYTIRNHDKAHPDQAVFPDFRGPLDDHAKSMIFKMYRRGFSPEALAKRYHRTRSSIHRIILEVRLKNLIDHPIEFMMHPMFSSPRADEEILHSPEPNPPARQTAPRAPSGTPPYLQSLYLIPLLTREEEQYLFRKMNYLYYKANSFLEHIKSNPHELRASDLDQVERWREEGNEVKRRLIRANLRLVVSIAKRHVSPSLNLFELISDGNVSLMKAVEKFDFGRGFKFSTYASWAIMKNFARSIPAENTRRDRFLTGQDLAFELKADVRTVESDLERSQERVHSAVERFLARLDERERGVIIDRYGLENKEPSQTLEQVGQKWGVTKERIRQIEARALQKLKQFAREENIDLSSLVGQ